MNIWGFCKLFVDQACGRIYLRFIKPGAYKYIVQHTIGPGKADTAIVMMSPVQCIRIRFMNSSNSSFSNNNEH